MRGWRKEHRDAIAIAVCGKSVSPYGFEKALAFTGVCPSPLSEQNKNLKSINFLNFNNI